MTATDKIKGVADWFDPIIKIAAGVGGAVTLLGMMTGYLQPVAREWIGITEMKEEIESIKVRLPPARIAIFDPAFSYIVGDCRIAEPCTARFKVKRTKLGKECDLPLVTPYIRNHGGIRHPAEYISGAIRAEEDQWEMVDVQFRAPARAKPGRAVYFSQQQYDCPFGQPVEDSIALNFDLFARKTQPAGVPRGNAIHPD